MMINFHCIEHGWNSLSPTYRRWWLWGGAFLKVQWGPVVLISRSLCFLSSYLDSQQKQARIHTSTAANLPHHVFLFFPNIRCLEGLNLNSTLGGLGQNHLRAESITTKIRDTSAFELQFWGLFKRLWGISPTTQKTPFPNEKMVGGEKFQRSEAYE